MSRPLNSPSSTTVRLTAVGVDLGLFIALLIVWGIYSNAVGYNDADWKVNMTITAWLGWWFFAALGLILLATQTWWVATRGQTIGKRVMGIIVVDTRLRTRARPARLLTRELLKWIFILPGWWFVQLIFVAVKNGYIHDVVTGTAVMDLGPHEEQPTGAS